MIPIKNYEGLYSIAEDGTIYSHSKGIIKNVRLDARNGYLRVTLSKDNKKKTYKIHRLLAEHFLSNPNGKSEINHINGIKTDNCLNNLEWCTRAENMQHAYDIGLNHGCYGELNGLSKLTSYQVLEIKKLLEEGKKVKHIADRYGVAKSTIYRIRQGKSWKTIPKTDQKEKRVEEAEQSFRHFRRSTIFV